MQAVSTAEMARRLDASPDKIRSMARSGEIPYIPVGRVLKFHPESVFAALQRQHEQTQATGRSASSQRARRKVA